MSSGDAEQDRRELHDRRVKIGLKRRCLTNISAADGSCYVCNAIRGEECQDRRMFHRTERRARDRNEEDVA